MDIGVPNSASTKVPCIPPLFTSEALYITSCYSRVRGEGAPDGEAVGPLVSLFRQFLSSFSAENRNLVKRCFQRRHKRLRDDVD